ncbi:MAG: amino acid adenylation domain-containing protein [Steroidobacteraceae bacterium]
MTDRAQISAMLDRLEGEGVQLWPEGDQLRFRSPRGALTTEQRALLGASRQDVIELLRERGARPPDRSDASAAQRSDPAMLGVSSLRDEGAAQLLEELAVRGVTLLADGDRLKVSAPKGTLDDDLKRRIGSLKPALLNLLPQLTAIRRAPNQVATNPALDRGGPLPVSHMQQRLWFLKQLDPENAAYNVPCAVRFTGTLLPSLVEQALDRLVRRHESLRARFVALDGIPYCRIDPAVPVELLQVDLRPRGAEVQDTDASCLQALRPLLDQPFDVSQAPLWRAALLRQADDVWTLCLVIDHMIIDGLSMAVLLGEFRLLYAQLVAGRTPVLEPLPAQYVDIVAAEQRRYSGGLLDQQLAFWRKELDGLPAALQLPLDRPRPPVQTFRGDRILRALADDVSPRVRAFGRELGATPFMVLLSAFLALLHRYAAVDDLAVGTAVLNRLHPDSAGVVGFFANNIVLRGDLSGNPTVRELVARTRATCLRCMERQEVPFDRLVDALVASRETDHSPLFQVMFVLQGWARPSMDLPGAVGELFVPETRTARYDLAVDLYDTDTGLQASFEYNKDLFDAATILRLMTHYERLLRQMLDHPDARIDDLELLDDAESRELLLERNVTRRDYPQQMTVHSLFEARAKSTPHAVALVYEANCLSYADLNVRANRLAHHLRSIGVRSGSLVGIWMERSVEMVVSVLGVLKAGAAYVPLDPAFPQDRVDFMMRDARVAAVLTQQALAATLGEGAPRAVCVDADADSIARESEVNPAQTSGPQDLAYVIYTSGSTGRPKGVMIEHRSVVNFLLSMHREPGLGSNDRFVAVTTLSFDIAGLELHGPLTAGGTVVLASRTTALDGVALAALLERNEATLLQATPATWRLLLESGWRGRPGLKMLCGGEGLPRDLAERLLGLGGELWNMYGPTETTIWSTICRVTDASRAIPIGIPIANTQVYVLEPSGQPAPVGVAGELCIAGAGLARGYLNRDELTAEKFVTLDIPLVGRVRVYRTGDLARWLANGQLEFIGRRDQQIKVRGFRIELGEIEAALAAVAGVRDNVVQVREDAPGDQRLVAYVVTKDGGELDADAARVKLRSRLPEYMVPNQFVTLAALPLTPNGKVDRKVLPAPVIATPDAAQDELMTLPQQQVAALWRHVLKVERVGLYTNFFDLGGHSLLLVRLQAALQRTFGRELPLIELFQHTTVAAQAARLAAPSIATEGALQRAQMRAARQQKGTQ